MLRVLVVDDEPSIANLLEAILRRAGYKVSSVLSAGTAILELSKNCTDVVLTDVRMRGADGHELARWIAQHCPQTRPILMSGYPGDSHCETCPYRAGCAYIQKPFTPQSVIQAVEEAIKNGGSSSPDARPPA